MLCFVIPSASFLNFGRARFPRLGNRFVPLKRMDTQEDVPTTAPDAVDHVDPAMERDGEGLFSGPDIEEDRLYSPRSGLIDDLQHEMSEVSVVGGDVDPTERVCHHRERSVRPRGPVRGGSFP